MDTKKIYITIGLIALIVGMSIGDLGNYRPNDNEKGTTTKKMNDGQTTTGNDGQTTTGNGGQTATGNGGQTTTGNGGQAIYPRPTNISIQGFAFNPQTVNITNKITVTWTNLDNVAHTVTDIDGIFDSGPLSPGQTFSYTFTQNGTFEYKCNIHPSIPHGKINVMLSKFMGDGSKTNDTITENSNESTIEISAQIEETEIPTETETVIRPTETIKPITTPGFGIIVAIIVLLLIHMYKRK